MQDPMPTLSEDRENPGSLSQADLHNLSVPTLNLTFNASTTSQTPLLHSDTHNQDQNQDRGHGQSHSGQELSGPESRGDPGATHTPVAYPPQSLLRTVSNTSSHVRSSIDTVRTLGSGSEESQRGLLSVGWELGAVRGDGRDGVSGGGATRGDEGGRGTSGRDGANGNTRNEESTLSTEELQARGEAPPYFEVVERQGEGEGVMEMTAMRQGGSTGREVELESGTIGTGQVRESRRRSGFRSFAARMSRLMPSGSSQSAATPPPPPLIVPLLPSPGTNPNTALSRTPSAHDPSPSLPTSSANVREHIRHRSATSGSGSTTFSAAISMAASAADSPRSVPGASLASASTASLSVPRSRSRFADLLSGNTSQATISRPGSSLNLSNQNLSTTSLSSTLISSPLPHTLVRASFVYPNAGPTTEQMRFISSRESIARFGVPYGRAAEQAVRVDASAAREEPPPFDWDGEGGGEEGGGGGAANEDEREADGGVATAEVGGGENATGSAGNMETQAPSQPFQFVAPKRVSHPGIDRQASQSSAGSFETAPEDVDVAGEEGKGTEWDFEGEVHGGSNPNDGTATPAAGLTLPNINVVTDLGSSPNPSQGTVAVSTVDAAKSVPTPPPTPPTAAGPSFGSSSRTGSNLGTQTVPRIEVAPASPA